MLNFKKIELRGFKSFADKVEIPFKEGVTAIIGPNGCGKSNIADAIKWTLGEQRIKQLRGKSTQDVIFAGTEKRKSMSYCEVSLYFDNTDQHIFPTLNFDEVVITRKLDRSGLSEYYVNNTRWRKTDLINLLRNTGVGKEGYSIIGQGKVAEIMSAKPDDRRAIFEEAAGISLFRAERLKAEDRLEKTELNLQAANQIIAETEKQIAPLKKQAETAQKYFELKDQLKYNEVNLYIHDYENNSATKQKIKQKIDKVASELAEKDREYRECCAKYDHCILESQSIDSELEKGNAELMSLKVNAARVEGEAGILKERVANLQNEIARLGEELSSIEIQLGTSDGLISACDDKKRALSAQYEDKKAEYEREQSKFDLLSKVLEGHESDLESSSNDYLRALEELNILKANYTGFQTEKGVNEDRARNLLELIDSKKKRLDEALTDLAVYDGNSKACKEKQRQLATRYNEAMSEKLEAQQTVEAYAQDIFALNSKLSVAQGSLQLYTSMKNDYIGYQEAVKRLMQDRRSDPALASRIKGIVAEILDVPTEYEAAIEYALGGAMQHVLVNTPRDAEAIIDYLKQKNYGRVTFRPLSACRPRPFPTEYSGVFSEPGCLGLASDLITYDKKYDAFVKSVLGATVVVNNLSNATRIFSKYAQGFKIVTLDGEIFTRSGEITGGSRRNQTQGLLSQEKQIEQAKANLERVKRNISKLTDDRNEYEARIKELDETIASISSELSDLRISIGLNEDKAKQCFEVSETLKSEIASDSKEYELLKASIKDIEDKLRLVDEREKIANELKEEYNALRESSKDEGTKQKSEREELSERVMQLRLDLATLKGELENCDGERFRLERERSSIEDDKLDVLASLKSAQDGLEKLLSSPEKSTLTPEENERISRLEERIASLSARKRTISDEIMALDAQKSASYDERQALNEVKLRNENMLTNVDIEIANQQQHILEEYDLTYASALQFKDEQFKAYGAQTLISDLKRSILRLGDINAKAQEMLEEREEYLASQLKNKDDIVKACDDITTVITALTSKMRDMFTEAFNSINENYKVIFSQLFGGGKGELRLNFTECDDVLDAGIDIYAQPPGKKLQNISLLSGGEQALTAIAILFSILKLKPMPFCLLDEIEAALDDANVNLFAEFLKKFSEYTQFIAITHRQGTMRHADTIFGVTMEEKGVTKIVSIELEDAIKQAG